MLFRSILVTALLAVAASTAHGQQPTAQQPAAQQPTAQQPTAQQPTAQQPTAQQPTAQQPAAQPKKPPSRELESGAPVPMPANMALIPVNSATAELKAGNSVIMRVLIRSKEVQDSITSDIKEIVITSVRNLSPGEYSLAIHSGKMSSASCDDQAIGTLFDPTGMRSKPNYACDAKSTSTTCAVGDLRGKFGVIRPFMPGTDNMTWIDPDIRFNAAGNSSILDRTVMLYSNTQGRIACGVLVANNATTQVPQPPEPAGSDAATERFASTSMLVLVMLASLVFTVLP